MRWDMEVEEIEAVLEKIWDLHDKLSDAIHTISRAHFLNSIKNLRRPKHHHLFGGGGDDNRGGGGGGGGGYVFVKEFRVDDNESAIREAKSLNAIRTALENLGEQLEFFHTVQLQQRAERDAAIARLEQSRVVLSLRLAEHHGKKYNVIDEALAFIGDVHDPNRFVSPDNLHTYPPSPTGENLDKLQSKCSNVVVNVLMSSFDFAKRSLKLDHVGGVLGNVALFTVSMLALLHLQQVDSSKDYSYKQEHSGYSNRSTRRASSTSDAGLDQLDVMLARG
ncbi:Plastid division protein PDV1 [Linum grandiflorum]